MAYCRFSCMRIIQIVESLDLGGLERLAVNLAIEQKRRGADPQIYCVCRRGVLADDAEAAGIPVRCFNKPPGLNPLALLRIARALMADRPEVVHTHNANIHHYGAVAAKLAAVPVVVSTRHSPLSPRELMYRERHFQWASRFTDAIVFVSNPARDSIVAALKLEKVRTSVVPTAIPPHPFLAKPASPLSLWPRLRFGTLGRMAPEKAHDVLIDAFCSVLKTFPSAELRIAGGGPLYKSLGERVACSGLNGRVRIEDATSDPASFLQGLDVFVLSSRSEGLPLVLLEAMAAGLPVVATRVGGIPDLVPEDTGWLCPAEDSGALAKAMISAVNSADLATRAARGKALVLQKHNIATMCDAYSELFAQISASKSKQRRQESKVATDPAQSE
jgi:glycosyltransferase involved in cell wall biosynthesis